MITTLHDKLLSLFVKESKEWKQTRARYGNFAGWSSIAVNSILFIIKLTTGLLINSLALVADSIHSISDTATSVIVIIGFRIAGKPPDKEHPFGHQRAEYVATLVIAIILIVAGIEFVREGIDRFSHPAEFKYSLPILGIIIFTMLVKFWMGHLTKYIGVKIDSQSIKADAVHHYTDVISTVFVLISVYLGKFGLYYMDGVGSGLVGLMLIYTGFSISLEAGGLILGVAPADEFIQKVKKNSNSVAGVIDSHDIIVHQYGDNKFISLHIEVNSQLSCGETHSIARDVEKKLTESLDAYVTVHIDPIELDNPLLKQVKHELMSLHEELEFLKDFHDVRMNREHDIVVFDVVFPDESHNHKEMRDKLLKRLTEKIDDIDFEIHIDPIFVNN